VQHNVDIKKFVQFRHSNVRYPENGSYTKWDCTFLAFDTVINISIFVHEHKDAQAILQSAVDWCRNAENCISMFIPSSDISQLNQAHGKRVEVSKLTWDLLQISLKYCKNSRDAFDITMGSVCKLWDFKKGVIPAQQDLHAALIHVDWKKLKLARNDGHYYAQLIDPLTSVDLGGIAKGYFADKLRELLISQEVHHGIINLGGNAVVFGGKPDGSPFNVGIRDPKTPSTAQAPTRILMAVPLHDGSVVTSGPYERYFTKNGNIYHHILSTNDGMPVKTDLVSASIISEKSIDGDGYSTTLFALGSTAAMSFVESTPEIEAILVRNDGKILLSSGVIKYLS